MKMHQAANLQRITLEIIVAYFNKCKEPHPLNLVVNKMLFALTVKNVQSCS